MNFDGRKKIEKFLVRVGKKALKIVYGKRPAPVGALLLVKSLSRQVDPLIPKGWDIRTKGKMLNNPYLAKAFGDIELGDWRLGSVTLNQVEQYIQNKQPKAILEFGSGVSTACLARYMFELYGDSKHIYIYSVEQDLDQVQKTMQLLKDTGLERLVKITHAPIKRQLIENVNKECYDLDKQRLEDLLGDCAPDFILIDGPSAEPGSRFGIIPLIREHLDTKAVFWLDDALRDGELEIAQQWEKLSYTKIEGVRLIDKGILVGGIFNEHRNYHNTK